jgi:MFS family permease
MTTGGGRSPSVGESDLYNRCRMSVSLLSNFRAQLALLATLQALLLVNNVTLIAINGLAGFMLAEDKRFATLPVAGYVLGAAVFSMLAAQVMRRYGRRVGYTIGSLVAIGGALGAWYAVSIESLPLLVAATFVTGAYNAFGVSYRFAAADVADAYRPTMRARAISLVLAGGIVGGIVGPELAVITHTMLPMMFAGSYLTLAGFAILSMLLAQLLRLPPQIDSARQGPVRPLFTILRTPTCWVAILVAALSYGVMNLVMVSTPLAMEHGGHPFALAALVLEWHVIGMFAPGLVTGSLISRFGIVPVIISGCLLMAACTVVALTGVDLMQFLVALFLLGVGWNFMYTGATALLTTCYAPQEKNKVQGFNDFCVFSAMVTSSFSSGVLLHAEGWYLINALSLPFVLLALGSVLWLVRGTGWRLGRVA